MNMSAAEKIGSFIKNNKLKIIFFVVVICLFPTAMIKVKCPICSNSGQLETSKLSSVDIRNLDATVGGAYFAVCASYRVYITDVTVKLVNQATEQANGYLSLSLIDYVSGRTLDTQYVVVDIPPKKEMNATYHLFFQTQVDDPKTIKISARLTHNMAEDKACHGTGYVKLNEWPLCFAMKKSITEAQKVEVTEPEFIPLFVAPEDWDITQPFELDSYNF